VRAPQDEAHFVAPLGRDAHDGLASSEKSRKFKQSTSGIKGRRRE
jgi:hypothetical protein